MERSILFHITRSVVSLQMQNGRRLKKKKLNNFHVTIRINSLFIKAIILVFKGEKKKKYIVYDDSESTKREQRKREEIVLESGTNRSL